MIHHVHVGIDHLRHKVHLRVLEAICLEWIVHHWIGKSHGVDHWIEHLHGLDLHHRWIVEHLLQHLATIFIKLELFFEKLDFHIFIIVAFDRLIFD
jgi:hypothetical protein